MEKTINLDGGFVVNVYDNPNGDYIYDLIHPDGDIVFSGARYKSNQIDLNNTENIPGQYKKQIQQAIIELNKLQ